MFKFKIFGPSVCVVLLVGLVGILGLARAQTTEVKPLAKCKVVEVNRNNGIKEVWCAPLLADGSFDDGARFKFAPLTKDNHSSGDLMSHVFLKAGSICTENRTLFEYNIRTGLNNIPRYPWTCFTP